MTLLIGNIFGSHVPKLGKSEELMEVCLLSRSHHQMFHRWICL